MEFLKYDVENKTITQEKFSREVVAKTESIFSLGNGYLGIRSANEEVTSYNKEDFFVNGIFNKDNAHEVSELCNLADSISTSIIVDDEIFHTSTVDQFEKTLDIRNGLLTRKVVANRKRGKLSIESERFVSQDDKHIYAHRIKVKVLDLPSDKKSIKIELRPGINGQVTNNGTQHFKEGLKYRPTNESLQMIQETTYSNRVVVHNMATKVFHNKERIFGGNDDYIIDIKRRWILFKIKRELQKGDEIILEKIMSVHTSVDDKNYLIPKNKVIEAANNKHLELLKSSYNVLKDRSLASMHNKVWNQFFVDIEGDEEAKYDKLALDFSIFHLNNFVPKDSTNMNVGAKGLSGEGYQGHTYWDTEFFINPNYLFNNPSIVRNLLTYRYKGIKGARIKAQESKQRSEESWLHGAQYPWEMAWPKDGEVCPYWGQADVVTGQQVPIASRRQEIHVSADIAYAINQYYQITKDQSFMNTMGYEMIIDTAFFYTNRAELQQDGSYEIKDVMGPNEYKGNIDNNAYINRMAKYNIDLALKYIQQLKLKQPKLLEKVLKKIPYTISVSKMENVSKKLKQQLPNDKLIIAENDQFLKLPIVDVKPFQMLGDAGKKLFSTKEGHKRLASQLVKQADVVLLLNILPQFYSKDIRKANFEYYEPLTTHDSSLSAATHVIEAARLRKMKKAYELFKYAINIDLGPKMHTSDAGIHAGALAAIWQMIIFGFGGLDWHDDKLHLNPILPKNWTKLTYRFKYQNVDFEVVVNQNKFTIVSTTPNNAAEIIINDKEYLVGNKVMEFEVQHEC